ncbi:proteasome subunit beta type-4-like [Rhopilema esculentum]|uniref:proteasome subunit beta type-4-like n=1 Tax=Rhopilema esculentum TaxID=499914 RepID=UPI0031D1CB5D
MMSREDFMSFEPNIGGKMSAEHHQLSRPELGVTRTMQPLVTGTSVLGVKFNGGVAIAADMLGSYGSLARFPGISRISKVNNETVIGASGDYADFQFLSEFLEMMMIENDVIGDGYSLSPASILSWITRYMYQRRSKFNPLWNTVVVAGFKKGKSLLGYVDKLGTAYQENSIATGYGAYIARPLLRDALEKNGNMSQAEAVKLLMDCLKVLYYRDARSLNKFEVAVVNETGVSIESGMTNETNWDIAHMVKGYE